MSKCIKQNTKKYKSRSSPPYSAMDCQGKVITGNDGATYISKPDKRGIYRWVKSSDIITSKILKNKTMRIKPKLKPNLKTKLEPKSSINPSSFSSKCLYKKTDYGAINVSKYIKCIPNDILKNQLEMGVAPKHIYEINDNASFPFVVFDYGGRVDIYNNHFNEETNKAELNKKLIGVKYDQIFIGDNESKDPYWMFKYGIAKGNTILLQTGKDKYMFIGKGILSFSTKDGDTIRRYYSPIGGNYDSFACAVGDKYVYLLNDKKYAPVSEFDINKDIIKQYYCYDCECKKYKTTTLPMKTNYAPFYGFY
jgi:hypothetical protein